MEPIRSINRLSFFRSHFVKDHKRVVVYPSYKDSIFGYYVGWETEETIDENSVWVYYPIAFFLRENEDSAQIAVTWATEFISTNPSN